jgi:D-3-phosphoglycerate dehydrogenase
MEELPNCKIIARYGIGVDTIDIEAATDLGIMVSNNPSYCVDEVAEHALALMLSAWRRVTQHAISVGAGEWAPLAGGKIQRLKGSKLGLVGFGAIGQALAARASRLVFFTIRLWRYRPSLDPCRWMNFCKPPMS